MSRVIVIALLAFNLLLAGWRSTLEPPPPPAPPPPVTDTAPPLVMLAELDQRPAPEPDAPRCFSAGPFETPATLEVARQALEGLGVTPGVRSSEALVELGYWVALPPQTDFQAAGEAMRRLADAGLEDLAVVSDGDGAFRVSLGYFLDENNALRRRDQVREQGFPATTRLVRETESRYWLDYRWPADAGPPPARSRSQTRSIPCPPLP